MPALDSSRQPSRPEGTPQGWFDGSAGRAVLESERELVAEALQAWPGRPWLWLAPTPRDVPQGVGAGLVLARDGDGWAGRLRCAAALPLADASMATVVLQHAADVDPDPCGLLGECARVLEPRGRLWLLALNPLTAYRRHWTGSGVDCREPVTWRRRLRAAGLHPDPVSTGIGPRWRPAATPDRQRGAGLRAAYLVQAEKRVVAPLRPRAMPALRWQPGLPA